MATQPTPAAPVTASPAGNNSFGDLIPASAGADPFGDLIPGQSSAVTAPIVSSFGAPDAPANASHAFPAAVQAPGNANAPADLTSLPSGDSAASSGGPQASGNPFSDLIPQQKSHGALDTVRLAGTALRDAAGAVAENIVGGVASLVPLAAGGLNAIVQGISHPSNFMQAAGQGLQSGEAAVENSKLYQLTQPQTELGKKVQNLVGEGFQKLTDLGAEGMAAQTELQAAVYDKLGLKDLAHWTRTHGVPIAAGIGAAAVNAPLLLLGAHAPEVREAAPEEVAPQSIAPTESPAGKQQIAAEAERRAAKGYGVPETSVEQPLRNPDIENSDHAPEITPGRLSKMNSEELGQLYDDAIKHNDATEVDAVRKFLGLDKATEFESIKGRRARDKWLDANVTDEMQDYLNKVQLPENTIESFSNAATNFDDSDPVNLGRSIAVISKDVDKPGFFETPEGTTFKNAMNFARDKGWDMNQVLEGMRERSQEWAGSDAAELFKRLVQKQGSSEATPMSAEIFLESPENTVKPEAQPVQPSPVSAASNPAFPAQARPPAALPNGTASHEPVEGGANTESRIDDYVSRMPHADQNAMSAVESPVQPTGMRRRSLSFAPIKPVNTVSRAADDIKRALAPATRGPYAEQAAGIVRAHNAQLARSTEVADAQLNKFKFMTARLQPAERLDFIDAIETGRKQPNTRLQPLADTLGSILEDRRKKIQDLGKGQLQNYIENYFPHLWQQKPEQVREILSKRSLTGPGSFLKERKIPTTREGIDMGLVPVTDNPIELALLKTREMDRYLMGQHIFRDLKEQDLARFVPFDKPAPSGWSKVNDKIAQVFLPPEYKIREAYDEHLFNQLNRFAHSLGIDTQRAAKIGGRGVWGYTSPNGAVVTRFAGPETVLTHEIGHQLDFKYGLSKQLVNNPATREELRKLADLRYEGKETTEHFKHYVRQSSEKIANLVHAFVHARERLHEVAPHAEAALVDIINAHPELKPLLDIKPSLVLGQAETTLKLPGIIKVGEYYAPDQAAHVINNFLSPGLRGNAVYDAARALSSAMNTAQLGLSAFHLGFTTMDTMISRFALGVKQLMEGRLAKGATNLIKGISPTTPVENYLKGGRLRKAYLSADIPENATIAAMVDALVQSGGRVKMDSFYRMSAAGSFRNALLGGQYGRAAKLFIPRLVDMINAPIFEHIVPRQKLGVFMELAKDELATHPDMNLDQKRRALAKVWDSVDNRMGQMVYDNLFWNKALKDLGMISVRSMGWNLGTFRELGGGAYDLARLARNREFTHRMAYVVALPVVTGLYGAMYQYLKTGQGPQELKDYFFPRTGAFRPDGSPDRVSLPSYMKDVYEYAHAPAETLLHKTNPLISTIGEMLQNEDFYGAAIRNPNDPLVMQAQDEWNYAINQFKPFSIRNFQYQNRLKGNAGGVTQYLTSPSFYGIVPSPAYITRSDEENRYIEERHMRPALRRKFREEYKLRR